MEDQVILRPATAADAQHIAELIAISSDGVALIDWSEQAASAPGMSPLDVGTAAYASEEGDYSYRNCTVAEVAGKVAGILLTFAVDERDLPAPPPPYDGSDVYAPYKYLEAPDTWYVCGVALFPEQRGRGIGSRLMALAEQQARERGFDRVSLVAFEENVGSVRLYQRLGYVVVDRAPVVPHPLIHVRGDALLMVKRLAD
jgi:ribosomal protein S18 acetylase RimI-like enzyme